ncbi:hypothetical protein [Bordetella sp. N]|uniref:hypothetical protein n=1 Tax=Bordetella sp. N TaxID=1746199 RepID=UPI001E3AB1A5|nr:hypothetical protein [Bordetella sp. N]
MAVLISLGLLAGCDREPVYRGVGFMAFNYTPFEMDAVTLTDKDGNRAGTTQLSVGGGEGSVSCCYLLKGTEFTVKWRAADPEVLIAHIYDDDWEKYVFTRERAVHFPRTEIPPGDGPLYVELHIYPDDHVEMALGRKLIGGTRIPIVETTQWLWRQHRDALGNFRDLAEFVHVVAHVTKMSWDKYRIEDKTDMREYMKMYFTVSSNFDQSPEIRAVLEKKDRKPGEFARLIESLSPERIATLKSTGTPPGNKIGGTSAG